MSRDWRDLLPDEELFPDEQDRRVAGKLANRIARLPGDRSHKVAFFEQELDRMELHLGAQKDPIDPEREHKRYAKALQKLAYAWWLTYWHSAKREKPQMTGPRMGLVVGGKVIRIGEKKNLRRYQQTQDYLREKT